MKRLQHALVNKRIQKDATEIEKIPFNIVEVAPVHADCIGLSENNERRECTTNAIINYTNKSFNTELENALGLDGTNKVYVSFIITSDGEIEAIRTRSVNPKLDEEAERVINLLPKFIPGRNEAKEVNVAHSLPIVFQVQGLKKD